MTALRLIGPWTVVRGGDVSQCSRYTSSAAYLSRQAKNIMAPVRSAPMATAPSVYDRINQLREAMDPPPGFNAFSVLVGRSHGWLSTLGTRTRGNPAATIDAPTAERIAKLTGARLAWILEGEPPMMEPADERYPERDLALAEYENLPAGVAAEIRSMLFHSGSRPTVERWKGYIDATLAAAAKGERFGVALPDADDAPRRGR